MDAYQQLKRERDRLQSLLNEHSDLRGHGTYKALERKLIATKQSIKDIFRQNHKNSK